MKKTASIFLLLAFLFNVAGYHLIVWTMRYRVNQDVTSRLDAGQYSKKETVTFRVPLTLPYPLQQKGFERVNGRFEHEGQFYKLVEHKLENDTLVLICFRNDEEKELVAAIEDYTRMTVDVSAPSEKKTNTTAKFTNDFKGSETEDMIAGGSWCLPLSFFELPSEQLIQPHAVFSPPPEV